MPNYVFYCDECNTVIEKYVYVASFDAYKKAIAKGTPKCKCNNKKMQKVIQSSVVVMRGQNVTIGELIDKGKAQSRPPEWFDEQSRNNGK